MFNLTDIPAKLLNLNCRVEKHGDKSVGANDLKIEVSQSNTVLAEFDPILLPYIFQSDAKNGDQHNLALGESGDTFTHVRKSSLSAPKSEREFPGYTVKIGSPGGFAEPVELFGCELSAFQFDGLEGGAVKIVFRAACTPTDEEVGRLRGLLVDGDVMLTLIPPQAAVETEVTSPTLEAMNAEDAAAAKNAEFADAAADAIAEHKARGRRNRGAATIQ